jgi:hypothetical protein
MNESNTARFAELLDWLEGRLPADEARALADRLQNADDRTQADLAWLRAFLQASQTVRLDAPPARVRATLRNRFADYAQAGQPPGFFRPDIYRRWLATLTFDSRAQPATAGLRSAAAEGLQRQLIYTTEVAEIALNLYPRPPDQRFNVTGQVFPKLDIPRDVFSVQLLRGALQAGLTMTDDLGEFAFDSVPAGEYELVISAGDFDIVIVSVQLQP